MEVAVHGEHLVRIKRYPRSFPVNVYLARKEDGLTLVDAGLRGSEREVLGIARERGGEIRRIVLTHAHADDGGSLDGLRDALPEAEVLVPAREARFSRGDLGPEPEGKSRVKLRGSWKAVQTRPTGGISPGDRVGSLAVGSRAGTRGLPRHQGRYARGR